MDIISSAFHFAVYQPLATTLLFLYNATPLHDYGVAVILLTLLTRLLLYPLNTQSIKAQQKLSQLQPKLKELQKTISDKTEQARATLELYKKEGVNPLSSLLPILIQLPLLIGLWQLFTAPPPDSISPMFLGIVNLQAPHFVLAFGAGVAQFFQAKYSTPSKGGSQTMPAPLLFFFPVFTFLILSSLPSALGLYWFSSSVFGILQQWIVTKKLQ
ncbi:MAG: YidC/Oxa1 family membrane protein insertase [bacterium]|nr:YidC/Oxa1 family membrane protein insertase [bacterium]